MPDSPARRTQPDERPASAAVFDIDGVLADVRHRLHHVARRPKDWEAFFGAAIDDPPLAAGLDAVATALRRGHVVMYLTGRPERCRSDTASWLAHHGLPAGQLFMRADHDRRPARVTKVVTLRRLAGNVRIAAFVDDDAAVVAAVRRAGFPVIHAQWMEPSTSGSDSSPAGPDARADLGARTVPDVLFEIQEGDART